MLLPTPPAKGDNVHIWARNITNYLRSLRPSSGPGIRIQHTPAGMAISTDLSRTTPTVPPLLLPWQAYPAPYEGEGEPPPDQWKKFKVNPGLVNNLIPDNPHTVFTCNESICFGVETTLARIGGNSGHMLPVSCEVVLGTYESFASGAPTVDVDGFPQQVQVLLGQCDPDEVNKAIRHTAYRTTSLAIYSVLSSPQCNKNAYQIVVA